MLEVSLLRFGGTAWGGLDYRLFVGSKPGAIVGHPAHNGQKYFFAATVEDLRRDEKWFSRASDAIVQYWRYKNSRKGKKSPETQQSPDKNTDAADVAEIQN